MYKYKVVFQEEKVSKSLIDKDAFDSLEARLEDIKKVLRQSKIETIKYYRENPNSYSVVTGTDLINDYINDIETLLNNQ